MAEQESELFSMDETRRHFIFENASPFVIGISDAPPPIKHVLETFAAIEKWLINGTIPKEPEKPKDPKDKFKVV